MPKIKFSLPLSCSDSFTSDTIDSQLSLLGMDEQQIMDLYDKYPGLYYVGFEYNFDFEFDTDTGQIIMFPLKELTWNLAE